MSTTSLPTPAARRDTAPPAAPNGDQHDPLTTMWRQLIEANAHPNSPHRLAPSPTQVAVLRALAARDGESWAQQLARDTGRERSNLARHTLPSLRAIGVIDYGYDEQRMPHGGVPARIVRFTRAGRRLVELLPAPAPAHDELGEVA